MKKLLGIVVLGLLLVNNSYSNENSKSERYFNKWLYDNDHHQYLNSNPDVASYRATVKNKKDNLVNIVRTHVSKSTAEGNAMVACELFFEVHGKKMQKACYIHSVVEVNPCKTEPKYSQAWYYNKCDKFQRSNNLNIKIYGNYFWIPEPNEGGESHPSDPRPNYGTLLFELYRYLYDPLLNNWDKYLVKKSDNPYKFESNLTEDKLINKQLNKTGLLSYLFFENDEIKIDKISPKDRFGKFIDNKTKFRSMSVGKTMVSYVTGHAICEGYIDSVDQRIDDWDLVKNTLYDGQKLIDLLNMWAGDQEYVWNAKFLNPTRYHSNEDRPIETLLRSEFANSKKSKPEFNYSSFIPNLILNYVMFKTGEDFEKILEKTFKEKARIEEDVFFYKFKASNKKRGDAQNMFYATRYDYLRIARAMLKDWQNNTCEGQYLKTLFERKISKEYNKKDRTGKSKAFPYAKNYAGQFHTSYKAFSKKRPVMGMHGFGGQHIVIDFEKSRIVVTNSIHENWSHRKSVYLKLRKGIK